MKHVWKFEEGESLLLVVCVVCHDPMIPAGSGDDWRLRIAEYKDREDCIEPPTPAQVEFQKRLEYTEDGLSAVESHQPMAKVIWETSHRDEGTISATGANNIAKALIMAGYGKLSQELPTWPRRVSNADYDGEVWEYEDGHKLYRGMEVPPPGENDIWQQMDPFMFRSANPEDWGEQIEPFKAGPGRVMEIPPSAMDRIADALENISKHGIKTVSYNGGDL